MVERNLTKAEKTAVDAAKAMIKIFDFSESVLEALSRAVTEASGLKVGKYDLVKLSTQDARVIRRYTKSQSHGESRVQRYIYTLYSSPSSKKKLLPFILISLVNKDGLPPGIVFGIVEKIQGEEKTDNDFIGYFLLWINEQLKDIREHEGRKKLGWEIEHELSGKADMKKLRARVSFEECGLFDITSEEMLSERAMTISNWFKERLQL